MSDNYNPVDKIRFIHGLLRKEVEELIKLISTNKGHRNETSNPPMDVLIKDTEVVIYVELPGLTTDDFSVYQYNDIVVIEGVRPRPKIKDATFVRVERESVRFKRILHLPFCVDDAPTKAKLKDGVLEIVINFCECFSCLDEK